MICQISTTALSESCFSSLFATFTQMRMPRFSALFRLLKHCLQSHFGNGFCAGPTNLARHAESAREVQGVHRARLLSAFVLATAQFGASAALLNGASTGGVYVKPSGNVFIQGAYSSTFATPELTYAYAGMDDGVSVTANGRSQVTADSNGVYLHAQSSLTATVQAQTPGAKRFAVNIGAGFTDQLTVYGSPNETVVVEEQIFGEGTATGTGDAYIQGGFSTAALSELYTGSKQCYFNITSRQNFGICNALAVFVLDQLGTYTFQAGVGISPFSEADFASNALVGSTSSGSVDFWNTAGISHFKFMDTAGDPLSLHYTTLSGVTYGGAAVPEPATGWLILVGFGSLLATTRRKYQGMVP